MRGLFVEPFYGGSHRTFLDGLIAHADHEIVPLTLPEGEWRRRMRRGAQELSARATELEGEFDYLVATDMLDLPAFLALTRRRFASLPVMLYMHENQFTYPRIRGTKLNSWFGQINYLSACVADDVVFNSEYHRGAFLAALETLASQPNNWLMPESLRAIEAKSRVLAVGVDLRSLDEHQPGRRVPSARKVVLWNHRWEFDKAPETFARVMLRLADERVPFDLAIAGEPGDNPSPALASLRDELPERVTHFGFLPSRAEYARLLWESDIVVSTSRHEFFGVSTVEALYCGCFPVVPASQNYPSLVPFELHASCLWRDERECQELVRSALLGGTRGHQRLREHAGTYDWKRVAAAWNGALRELAERRQATGLQSR
jgi:glycosyltransferase involved in cell wall biosynthesis